MVVLKWIQSILLGIRNEVAMASGAQHANEQKKTLRTRPIDLVNAALVDHAEDLEDLLTSGSTHMERKRLKRQIKEKVASCIADEFNDPELIEEVTERITDAAEIDPYYKNMFTRNS